MEVRFTHPRDSSTYLAEVSPHLTVGLALEYLLSPQTGPFLPAVQQGENYEFTLRRTNAVISLAVTFGSVGVVDQDTLDITLIGQGA